VLLKPDQGGSLEIFCKFSMGLRSSVTIVSDMDLESLISSHQGPLIALISAWGASPRDAVELAQDTFSEAYLSRDRYKGEWDDMRALGAWLLGIANNLFHAGQRASSGSGRLISMPEVSVPDRPEDIEAQEREERVVGVQKALLQLKATERTVLLMRYTEGSSLAVIGSLLGLGERAVEGRLRRARAALKEQLEKNMLLEERS
jgi:RNA polymerase sigma-70 factor (ECF subfamily)